MDFRVAALPASRFTHLYEKDDASLEALGVIPYTVNENPGFPCRVTLRDADPGRRIFLLNFEHQPTPGPYRSAHAIFVLDGAQSASPAVGEVPDILTHRLLSVRGFSHKGLMTSGRVVEGADAAACFTAMLADPHTDYLHAHTAARGCFLARIEPVVE